MVVFVLVLVLVLVLVVVGVEVAERVGGGGIEGKEGRQEDVEGVGWGGDDGPD